MGQPYQQGSLIGMASGDEDSGLGNPRSPRFNHTPGIDILMGVTKVAFQRTITMLPSMLPRFATRTSHQLPAGPQPIDSYGNAHLHRVRQFADNRAQRL